ncbi:lipoprotein insertase outer membrane protein LolB [Oxalicibacterium flavum]|uniref:lipoprotein insertase outer membrane protein LolB n=1 Tax=Oxalicibacterium flavum TaxID=179467 RepID=UPI0016681F3D|nr:lipoprotein insertase outer membrane protein LolB [Oxalicibacterium flavum]
MTSILPALTPFRFSSAVLLAASLLLGGCSSMAPPADTPGADSSAARNYRQTIEIAGRLSVQYRQNGNDESLHGSFTWQQNGERSNVTLLSPLGQIIATIAVEPGGATLTESGKAPRSAGDVDALVAQTLGWPLPIAGLRQWLQGFATDANGNAFVANGDGSTVTTQDGWQIRYANWQRSEGGDTYARRIDLARHTVQAGKVEIRIVIDNWQPR